MNKLKIFSLATAFSVALTACPMLVHGDEAEYVPEDDPLVSLSYINEVVTPEYDKKIEELTSTIDSLTKTVDKLKEVLDGYEYDGETTPEEDDEGPLETDDNPEETEEQPSAIAPASNYFEVVYLKNGAKIMAESPCEIILRSGSAIAVSIIANGLNDMTDGTELLNADDIPLFHHLLVPRGNDGRGIQITSEESYIMVRGDYSIVE